MPPTDPCEKWLKVAANLRVDHKDKSITEPVHKLEADGIQLRIVRLTDYTVPRSRERERVAADRVRVVGDEALFITGKVRTLRVSPDELRARWADSCQRANVIHQLA